MMVDLRAAVDWLLDASPKDLQRLDPAKLKRLRKVLQTHSKTKNSVETLFDAIKSEPGWQKVQELSVDRVEIALLSQKENSHSPHRFVALRDAERGLKSAASGLCSLLGCWYLYKEYERWTSQNTIHRTRKQWTKEHFPEQKWNVVEMILKHGETVELVSKQPYPGIIVMMSPFSSKWQRLKHDEIPKIESYCDANEEVKRFAQQLSPYVSPIAALYAKSISDQDLEDKRPTKRTFRQVVSNETAPRVRSEGRISAASGDHHRLPVPNDNPRNAPTVSRQLANLVRVPVSSSPPQPPEPPGIRVQPGADQNVPRVDCRPSNQAMQREHQSSLLRNDGMEMTHDYTPQTKAVVETIEWSSVATTRASGSESYNRDTMNSNALPDNIPANAFPLSDEQVVFDNISANAFPLPDEQVDGISAEAFAMYSAEVALQGHSLEALVLQNAPSKVVDNISTNVFPLYNEQMTYDNVSAGAFSMYNRADHLGCSRLL